MNTVETTFRRNLMIVTLLHIALIAIVVSVEGFRYTRQHLIPPVVDLIVPADILGDLPQGPGHGKGAYAAPSETVNSSPVPVPTETNFTPEEQPVPMKTKAFPSVASEPGVVKLPKKPVPAKTLKSPAKTAVTNGKPSSTPTVSANDYRQRFAKALATGGGSASGTPYGDNRPAGGGSGKSTVIGSPDGSPEGVIGGQGKGSPFWSYYLHVRDRMYEAWEQPGQALNWDKKLMTGVLVRVARDGKIVGVSLKDSSGNGLMDSTALAAARKVERLDPLPDGLGGATAEITVFFQLEG